MPLKNITIQAGPRTKTFSLYSRRMAIREHCLNCVGGKNKEIRECDAMLCPLWVFRPFQSEPQEKAEP